MSFESHLFFGIEVDKLFKESLKKVDPNIKSFFIQKNSTYLQEYMHEGVLYLGKFIDASTTLQNLDLLEANIYSLLEKIVPNYPYEKAQLVLLPVIGESEV